MDSGWVVEWWAEEGVGAPRLGLRPLRRWPRVGLLRRFRCVGRRFGLQPEVRIWVGSVIVGLVRVRCGWCFEGWGLAEVTS